MRAIQMDKYRGEATLREVPVPAIRADELLLRVRAAAVNPLDGLILRGEVRLIQDYPMPQTLGNECSGVVEAVGEAVSRFRPGDAIYCRLPWNRIGAFADYVAVPAAACAPMPAGCDFPTAAAIPLTGLTAWQGITEELEMTAGETLLITGGSGSFGEMAVPIAKALGLRVIVSGNSRARERLLQAGADQYIDYKEQNYWEVLDPVDGVIDTLGAREFAHALSVVKPGGRLLSLRTGPNSAFAQRYPFPTLKRWLFGLAGQRYDRRARKEGKSYRFMFVRADGEQLASITRLVEERGVRPQVAAPLYTLEQTPEALARMAQGHTDGKIVIRVS